MSANSVPTLWDPLHLFFYLLVRAGVSAAAVVVVTALLASYQAAMGWLGFGKKTIEISQIVRDKAKEWTSEQLRALVAFGFFSVVTVCFSYMLAAIGYAAILMMEADPKGIFTPGELADHVRVDLWPPVAAWVVVGEIACVAILGFASIGEIEGLRDLMKFAGGLLWVAAWIIVLWLGVDAIGMFLMLMMQSSPPSNNPVPVPLIWDCGITAAIALVVTLSIPRIERASGKAFARPGSS